MKIKIFLLVFVISANIDCNYAQSNPKDKLAQTQPVLVELFTSEGCSSCPAADALMPELKAEYKDKLIILSFHVDYWDRLGWKDAFSSSEWTRRQNQYASAFGTDNIYTPEAIVDGKTDITGSNRDGLIKLINNELAKGNERTLNLNVTRSDDRHLSVAYNASLQDGEVVSLALVQRHAVVNVRRGENSGRELSHYNIVRDFKTMDSGNGSYIFTLPDNIKTDNVDIIGMVQQINNMHIIAVKEINI